MGARAGSSALLCRSALPGSRRALQAGIAMAGLWVPAAAASPSKPANDDFRNATPITTPRFTDSINTSKAKAAKDDPTDCGPTSNSVWYVLTAETPMLVAMGTL